jgi:hypothetical protein
MREDYTEEQLSTVVSSLTCPGSGYRLIQTVLTKLTENRAERSCAR